MPLTKQEIIDAQRVDSYCQTILAKQSKKLDHNFEEGEDGVLRRRHPQEDDVLQIVLPEALCPRFITFAHHSQLGSHPGEKCKYHRLRRR